MKIKTLSVLQPLLSKSRDVTYLPALKIALAYGLFAALWIILSDRIIEAIAINTVVLSSMQTMKGLFFIVITTALIFILIYRSFNSQNHLIKELKESENKYRTLFEQSADAILIIEGDKFVDCNTATVKMLGYKSKKELLETHPSELSPEIQPDGSNSREKANEIMSTFDQGSFRFEWDHKRQNGEVFPVEVVMTAVPIGERKFFHIVWRDITERKRAEATLRESNERFTAAFADAAIGMVLASLDHRIMEANQAFCNMLGYSKEELVGVLINDITHPDDVDTSLDYYHKLITSESDKYHFEKRYLHKQGHEVWGLLSASLVRDKNANPLYAVAQIQNITERKQAEDELQQYQMQLRSLASEITIAEEQERRRIAVELHDHIIQDLGLSKIKLGELIQRLSADDCLPLAEETRELIERIIKESRSLVFDLSLPILYELGFEAAIRWLAEQTAEKLNIPFEVQEDDQPKPMNKEMQVLLFKAVRELMINISKHAHANEVSIFINRVNGQIDISVQDDGVGFDPDHIALYSGEALKFGLFGIKERLNLLNGLVKISSSPGSGTNITLTAPLEIND
jgi:PAS domain S-box-containing protein